MTDRVDVGSIRRAQIVEAASRVIGRLGIQNASLAEIEREAGISRGVLTYHFASKEGIILAVFDATIARMRGGAEAELVAGRSGWARLEAIIDFLLVRKPREDEFDCLHYTFLAQMSHREDFRASLAAEYAWIRDRIALDLAEEVRRAGVDPEDAKALAAIVHGALGGLIMQINVDPDAVDREALVRVLRSMILGHLGGAGAGGVPGRPSGSG